MEWKDEYDDILSRFDDYQDGKCDGIEQKEREIIINMYDNNISIETIAKIAKVSLDYVKDILNEETVTVK